MSDFDHSVKINKKELLKGRIGVAKKAIDILEKVCNANFNSHFIDFKEGLASHLIEFSRSIKEKYIEVSYYREDVLIMGVN